VLAMPQSVRGSGIEYKPVARNTNITIERVIVVDPYPLLNEHPVLCATCARSGSA